ncbi:hypothetical protein Btru_010729 [Bulinus truncatus]|nr:hypothetical protein Btru_010729 [Bulinus truncatus]
MSLNPASSGVPPRESEFPKTNLPHAKQDDDKAFVDYGDTSRSFNALVDPAFLHRRRPLFPKHRAPRRVPHEWPCLSKHPIERPSPDSVITSNALGCGNPAKKFPLNFETGFGMFKFENHVGRPDSWRHGERFDRSFDKCQFPNGVPKMHQEFFIPKSLFGNFVGPSNACSAHLSRVTAPFRFDFEMPMGLHPAWNPDRNGLNGMYRQRFHSVDDVGSSRSTEQLRKEDAMRVAYRRALSEQVMPAGRQGDAYTVRHKSQDDGMLEEGHATDDGAMTNHNENEGSNNSNKLHNGSPRDPDNGHGHHETVQDDGMLEEGHATDDGAMTNHNENEGSNNSNKLS